MKVLSYAVAAVLAAAAPSFAVDYPLTEDSKPHEGVPKGEKLSFEFSDSKIFPGTTRKVTVYVPKQYDPAKPACVWVNQDGLQHKADIVFDNLIARGEMPVTIYIAASPGVVKALDGKTALDRFNRSREYDGLGDAYARFVLEELLPFVEKQKTSDGRPIVLSKKGNDRCIGGSSSGAVCAFTAAWERPKEFRRVFSTIGTYVGLQGADVYPTLIRKYEPKGLRVFLQDGDHDQNIYGGDWWMANQMMERALAFAGYEVNHAWGQEGHNAKQGDQIFPDAVRWIWKDWPKEPQVGKTGNAFLNEILIPEEGWEEVTGITNYSWGMASAPDGSVVIHAGRKTYQVAPDGKAKTLDRTGRSGSVAFGPDGKRYDAGTQASGILIVDNAGKETIVSEEIKESGSLVVLPDSSIYVTQTEIGHPNSAIWHIAPDGKASYVDGPSRTGDHGAEIENTPWLSGITISPDHSLLYAANFEGRVVYSYQIQADGSLKNRQPYFHLHLPDTETEDAARTGKALSLCVDTAGRLYVGTPLGIQVCDQAGRVNCILPTPNGGTSGRITFGGANFDTLYVSAGDKVYRRKVKAKGAPAFAAPMKPAAPHL